MSETKQEKGTGKILLVAGGIIFLLLLIIVALAMKVGGGGETQQVIEDTGGGVGKISLPAKTLGPGETVEAFDRAVVLKRYGEAVQYVSSQVLLMASDEHYTKWDFVRKYAQDRPPGDSAIETKIGGIEYFGPQKTATGADVELVFYNNKGELGSGYITLLKEEGAWKILEY